MSKKTILLVDDDAILGEVLRNRLEEEGYACLWESDGEKGLETMRAVHPDLLLLDIVMPNMNGYEVLEVINRDASLVSIPVIVISNSGQPVEIERILGLGVKDYIVKAQFSPEEVITKIKKIIGGGIQPNAETNPSKKSPAETKLLIVEDEVMLSDIASDRFRHDGYQVFNACDGKEALVKAKEVHPDLILLDLIMPGIGGFDVLRTLKANPATASVPVVIFSNLAQESDILESRRLGAIDFLVKANFTPSQLLERVRILLAKE